MIFLENLRIALVALRANLLRSILTSVGIVVGTAAVIAVVSIVQGLEHMITGELQRVGATFLIVMPEQPGHGNRDILTRPVKLTWDDGQAIARQVRGIHRITPVIFGNQVLKYLDRQHTPDMVFGVTEDWPEVNNHAVGSGRFISRIDRERRRKVAVIGATVVEELRLGDTPIGKEIYVGSLPVQVIGVMEERGQVLGQDTDDLVFLPFASALQLYGRTAADRVQLRLRADNADIVQRVRDDIRQLLRQRHDLAEGQPDDFQVILQDEILSSTTSILGGVTAVVGAVVGIALLVGGIGIMNILLVSVTERTREIGLRKSVGARRRDILLQFLIEAVVLSLVGGLIGIATGYGIGAMVSNMLPGDWPAAHVPLWAIALAFGFCAMVGIGFGIYPASRAARLDPIEALRHE